MKNAGWIEDSTSEFCSPVLIIPKGLPHENKGYRFVVDLRQLNARTKSLQYMVPELGEMWAKLRNAKFISKLDLRHGFWQMGLHPDSRHKTSFSCEYGTFQYRVLPMGLLTASAAFQRWVGRVPTAMYENIPDQPAPAAAGSSDRSSRQNRNCTFINISHI